MEQGRKLHGKTGVRERETWGHIGIGMDRGVLKRSLTLNDCNRRRNGKERVRGDGGTIERISRELMRPNYYKKKINIMIVFLLTIPLCRLFIQKIVRLYS